MKGRPLRQAPLEPLARLASLVDCTKSATNIGAALANQLPDSVELLLLQARDSRPMRRSTSVTRTRPVPSGSDPARLLQRLLSPACFWSPDQLGPQPSWLEHAPFAFWLIEALHPRIVVELGTHGGFSYFVFCKAVQRLQFDTKCYAVDTWKGDEHAGHYGENVYQRVRDHNDQNYAEFSTLLRTKFDEARPHFSEGSIDLLHIDGQHFYEDVKHDFESWRPKLSDRSIVLFHDTNVRERGFGVFKLWEELRLVHPQFEFFQGHGLGVLGIGSDLPDRIRDLLSLTEDEHAATQLRMVYSRLGSTFSLRFSITQLDAELTRRNGETDAIRKAAALNSAEGARLLGVAQQRIVEQDSALQARAAEVARLVAEKESAESRASELAGLLSARAADMVNLEEKLRSFEHQKAGLQDELETQSAAAFGLQSELQSLHRQATNLEEELKRMMGTASRLEAELQAMRRREAEREVMLRVQSAALAVREAELQSVKTSTPWGLSASLRSVAGRFPSLARGLLAGRNLLVGVFTLQLSRRQRQSRQALADLELVKTSPFFDRAWYFEQYPDVYRANIEAAWHYLSHGAVEGRNPGPLFDGEWYLDQNDDVRSAGMNPLVHYMRYGVMEGRLPSPLLLREGDRKVPGVA